MTMWIILAIIAQFINSIVALIDKFIVTSRKVPIPSLYVFYTGILVIFSLFLYIFSYWIPGLPSFNNVFLPSFSILMYSFVSAFSMLLGIYFLFKSLVKADASDVFPVIGSISAFFSLLISFFYFGHTLHPEFFFGFIFLALGTLFVSHFRFERKIFYMAILSSLFLSAHSVSLKQLFISTGFDNGFFWYSLFVILISASMLFSSFIRKHLFQHRKSHKVKNTDLIIIAGKILAGIGGILLFKAIDLGNVAIVQSLGGLQFFFLFLFAILLGPKTHKDFGENVTKKDIVQKLISVTLILIGFVLLFL